MKIFYTANEINDFYYYRYEWIDYLECIHDPIMVIDNYIEIEQILKKKFSSIGWDKKNNIGVIWIPPFALGSIVLGGADKFLEKYGAHTFNNGVLDANAWTKGLFIFHVKNISDGDSILLSPIELNIPGYGLD